MPKLFKMLVELFYLSCTVASATGNRSGLQSFIVTISNEKESGTDDNVKLQLSGGKNGETCITGVISISRVSLSTFLSNSWSRGDTERYEASKQDFGTCVDFEADKSEVSFTIVKDGEDGLTLSRMEIVINNQIYIWEGKCVWDPIGSVMTARNHNFKGEAFPWISLISIVVVISVVSLSIHAVYTCHKYKTTRPEDINVTHGTREAPSAFIWILSHIPMYVSCRMRRRIKEEKELHNAQVEINPVYGLGDEDEENEVVDYNPYYA